VTGAYIKATDYGSSAVTILCQHGEDYLKQKACINVNMQLIKSSNFIVSEKILELEY
jgi:hypothetical protein